MSTASIRDSILSAREHVRANQEQAIGRDAVATARLENGLRCTVTGQQGQALESDMVKGIGGSATAPTPGWLMRAAHASCDATVIAMRAAEESVELTTLEVAVGSESDDRGLLGIGDALAGPLSTSIKVRIGAEDESPERLRKIVDWALEHSPVHDAMHRPVPVSLDLEVVTSKS